MRVIQVRVPESRREPVTSVLDDEQIDHVVTREAEGDGVVVEFPLPTEGVEEVLELLRADGDLDYAVVISAESADTEHFEELEGRYVQGHGDEGIAPEEIRATALGLNPSPLPYYAMTLLSVLVAVAGLLLDSPAIVVGSMVIAPQVGSALTASVGAVLDDHSLVRQGLASQVLGLGLAVVGAAVFGWLLRSAAFIPSMLDVTTVNQIGQRISPGMLSVTVGLSAGAAGAVALATALPVSLVGVMVAAALIPAAAAVGIGIAWGLPTVALGALLLLVVNTAAVNLAGIAGLWTFGYRPDDGRTLLTVLTVAALLLVLVGSGAVLAEQVAFENAANTAVEDVLERDRYEALELVGVRTEFVGFRSDDGRVSVVVTRPADRAYPDLAATVSDRLAATTDRSVAVEVEFRERQSFEPASFGLPGQRHEPGSVPGAGRARRVPAGH